MHTMEISFDDFDKQQEEQKAKNSVCVFVNSKVCSGENGLSFRPYGGLYRTVSVFDQQLKQNRPPRDKEKATVRYLMRGLDPDRNAHIYQCPTTVVEGIKSIFDTLESQDTFVTVTVTGSGMSTEYSVKKCKDKSLSGKITAKEVEALKALDLATIAESLIKPDVQEDATPVGAATGTGKGKDDFPFA